MLVKVGLASGDDSVISAGMKIITEHVAIGLSRKRQHTWS